VSIEALILDYGGVLSFPQSHDRVAAMAKLLGSPVDEFERAYHEYRDEYDAGVYAPVEYWERVLARLAREHLASPSLTAALIEEDIASWSDFRENVWALAKEFHAKGARLAFLSNNVPPLMERLRDRGRLAPFDVVMASCELGFCKPDPRIYRVCLEALRVRPTEALLVDDTPVNVDAASALGIESLLFEGDDAFERLRWRLAPHVPD